MSNLRHSSLTKKKRNKKSLFGKISDFRYIETQYSKPRYSKILYIVNKTQLPSWDFIEILCLDIGSK